MAKTNPCRASIGDRLLAFLFAVFAVFLVVPVCAAIRLTSENPVFVTSPRLIDGRLVPLLQFHTTENGEAARVIRRFLEHFGIDKVPALANVIRGDLAMRDYLQFVAAQK